jgi:hypothetical protein
VGRSDVGGTGSGPCTVVGFSISIVEPFALNKVTLLFKESESYFQTRYIDPLAHPPTLKCHSNDLP